MNKRFSIFATVAVATVFLLSAGPTISGDEKDAARTRKPLAAFGLDGAVAMKDSELDEVSGDSSKSGERSGLISESSRQTGLAGRPATSEVSGSRSIRGIPGVVVGPPSPSIVQRH